jgi:hypothetical protein
VLWIGIEISKKPYRSSKVFMPSILWIITREPLRMLIELMTFHFDLFSCRTIDEVDRGVGREDIAIEVEGSEGDMGIDEEIIHRTFR